MNARQAQEFLSAAAACDPARVYARASTLVGAVAGAAPAAEWEAGIRGGDASVLRLALRRASADAAVPALAQAFSLGLESFSGESARSRPWVDATLNLDSGAWARVEVASRDQGRELLRTLVPQPGRARTLALRRFSPGAFAEPIAGALKIFDALEPISAMRIEDEGGGWSLIPARPVPWPLFLRCDLSAAFAPRAAQLALLLRDMRVAALDFDGEALWARVE